MNINKKIKNYTPLVSLQYLLPIALKKTEKMKGLYQGLKKSNSGLKIWNQLILANQLDAHLRQNMTMAKMVLNKMGTWSSDTQIFTAPTQQFQEKPTAHCLPLHSFSYPEGIM